MGGREVGLSLDIYLLIPITSFLDMDQETDRAAFQGEPEIAPPGLADG